MEYVIDNSSKNIDRRIVIKNLSKEYFIKYKVYGIFTSVYKNIDNLLENIYFGKYKTDN